jgi:hypothetical protein
VQSGRFAHRGLPVVTFTHMGVLLKVNGPGVVFIDIWGARHNFMEFYHQHGS